MTTTALFRILAAIGNGPALPVWNWLVAAGGQPVQQRWIETMTDLSDKTVAKGLARLEELQYAARSGDGWVITTAHQGVLGDVLAALPSEQDGISDSGRLAGPDGDDITTGEGTEMGPDGISVSGPNGGGGYIESKSLIHKSLNHHQHHSAEDGISDSPTNLPAGDPDRGRARLVLLRIEGMWPKPAEAVLRELDPERGLRDVLGWVAYALHPDNGVVKPAPLVLGHLRRDEKPGRPWVPPQVCATCGLVEGFCRCATPAWHLPVDYDQLAFEPPPEWGQADWLANRWSCTRCGGHPCRCEFEEGQTT